MQSFVDKEQIPVKKELGMEKGKFKGAKYNSTKYQWKFFPVHLAVEEGNWDEKKNGAISTQLGHAIYFKFHP